MPLREIQRVVTGGQTGGDRAAREAALARGVPVGGGCPAGRDAEDGPIAAAYPLREALWPGAEVRSRLNVRDSQATLILAPGPLTGGTRLTAAAARAWGRPLRVLDPASPGAVAAAALWVRQARVAVLNVAGPRASEWPDGYTAARTFVDALLRGRP